MGRTVLLLHQLPDGSSHFDWLTETDPDGPLLSFRLQDRPDRPTRSFRAQRLPDHRPAYLDYEGPVSGNRGEVRRIASGRADLAVAADRIEASLDFGAGAVRYIGVPDPQDRGTPRSWWVFEAERLESPSPAR